jgi:hypothetical protein
MRCLITVTESKIVSCLVDGYVTKCRMGIPNIPSNGFMKASLAMVAAAPLVAMLYLASVRWTSRWHPNCGEMTIGRVVYRSAKAYRQQGGDAHRPGFLPWHV